MVKLNDKKRDDVKSLLEAHQKISDALLVVGKTSYVRMLYLNNPDENDNVEVELNYDIAKRTITQQKDWTEKELAKLGIEVG